jgi:anaerobic magnesium-protoporphyrin IX monomethyl ester cyclase
MIPRTASIGLITLNARYVHMALSVRCLRSAARGAGFSGVWLREYTVQTPAWKMAAELLAQRPAVLGFSVYIWNREPTLALIELLRKQAPELRIVVGGPEVSFEPAPLPYVDEIIAGEGERKWVELLTLLAEGREPDAATRARWAAYGTDLPALEALPFEAEDLVGLKHRLVYLESSRGCPFSCAFCLSALDEAVRFYPDAAVRAASEALVAAGARRIKFLDRTFNLGRARVRALFAWLMRFAGVEFHFEVVGDLLDEPLLALLETAPRGMFQFEIGIQSAHPETQRRVARHQKQARLFDAVGRLRRAGRVHLHLDLIWGLPGETLAEIRSSFEAVLALRPHQLQLGFLKVLPGAPIRSQVAAHGYVFQDRPPYEVIRSDDLSAGTVLALKRFEEVFDLYYNGGHHRFTLERLFQVRPPWEVFQALADHFLAEGLLVPAHGLDELTRHLLACARPWLPEAELIDLLKLDYCFHHRARRVPAFLKGEPVAEPVVAREKRQGDPRCTVVAFRHRIALHDGGVVLEPSKRPVWYAFGYPERTGGYFFHATLQALDEMEGAPPG